MKMQSKRNKSNGKSVTGRVTLVEVARRAGVSPATASLSLSGSVRIYPDTAMRVRRTAKELGYVPLRRRTPREGVRKAADVEQNEILLVSYGIDYGRLPAYARVLQAASDVVAEKGYRLVSQAVNTQQEANDVARQENLVGMLLLWQDVDEGCLEVDALQKMQPCVRVMGTFAPGSPVDHVTYDNRRVGQLAAEYLWQRGHRIAATIQYNQLHSSLFTERARAFVRRFEHLGGKATSHFFRRNSEAQQVATEIAALSPRPTGIFAGDDGVLSRFDLLFRHGGFVPGRDMEMIGCNNESHRLDDIDPQTMSIDLQLPTMIQQALDLMSRRRRHPDSERMQVLVEPKLSTPAFQGSWKPANSQQSPDASTSTSDAALPSAS